MGRSTGQAKSSASDYIRSIHVADLLGFAPRLTQYQADSAELIKKIRHRYFSDSTREMAVKLGIDTTQIYTWTSGIAKPTLSWWLTICSLVNIMPRELFQLGPYVPPKVAVRACQRRHDPSELRAKIEVALAANDDPSLWLACDRDMATYQTARRLFPEVVSKYQLKHAKYREEFRLRCEATLKDVLASEEMISLVDASKRLGTDEQTLRRTCPELSIEVGQKYRKDVTQACLSRIEAWRVRIREAVLRVDKAGLPLTRQNIALELGFGANERLTGETLKLIQEESRAISVGERARSGNEQFLRGKRKAT
jgi:hypothetical protein